MKFAIIDVETTGGSTNASRITEIAIYIHDGLDIIDEFVTLLNPEIPIPEFIVRLTGITDKMVANAPLFQEVARKIVEMTKDCVFVAHNVSFDYKMLRSEFKYLGYDFRLPHLCTVSTSKILLPGHVSYSLGKLSRALGIQIEGRHRAGGDALATVRLFEMLLEKDPNGLRNFIHQEVNPKSIHPNLNIEDVDNLPNKIGVYFFYNDVNKLIYIGKSKHIRKRVEQHLRNNKSIKGTRMIQDIARVEFELTGTELIALLRESELVKIHQPIYNRKLRKSLFPLGLFDDLDDHGYLNLSIQNISKRKDEPIIHFSTRKEGTDYLTYICEKFQLCQKLCDLYKTNNACFHHNIKQCLGACVQAEAKETYNQRVQTFIDGIAFEGKSFYLVDKGREKSERSLVLVENGVYRGYGFAPYHYDRQPMAFWKRYIQVQSENRDIKTIINQVVRKKDYQKMIEL
jgi:DNA polymerase III subunit epsilon